MYVFDYLQDHIEEYIPHGYKYEGFVGHGMYGMVFEISKNKKKYIYKISTPQYGTIGEGYTQKTFASHDLAPKVLYNKFFDIPSELLTLYRKLGMGWYKIECTIMEKVDGTLLDLLIHNHLTPSEIKNLAQQVIDIVKTMCIKGLIHGDMHPGNIMYKKDGGKYKLLLIDFGFSCCPETVIECNPELEFTQLLSTYMLYQNIIPFNVSRLFYDTIYSHYKSLNFKNIINDGYDGKNSAKFKKRYMELWRMNMDVRKGVTMIRRGDLERMNLVKKYQ